MSLRKRLLQLTVVAGLGAVGMLATPDQALAGDTWCANSCSAMTVCDAGGGGTCVANLCHAIDGRYYAYTIVCKTAAE